MRTIVTRRFKFDAAHYLENYVGKCSRVHGHTWYFDISVGGTVDEQSGMLIDFAVLKEVVEDNVLGKLDHAFLNEVVDFNPTAENIAAYVFRLVQYYLCKLHLDVKVICVTLWENFPDCSVTVEGVD